MNSSTCHRVVLYSRDGCHLCDAARDVIRKTRNRKQFDFVEYPLEESDSRYRRYNELLPVVLVDGAEIAYWRITESKLLFHLK